MNSPLKWLLYTSPIVFPSRVSRWRLTLPAARSCKPSGLMTPILVFMDDSCSFASGESNGNQQTRVPLPAGDRPIWQLDSAAAREQSLMCAAVGHFDPDPAP